MVSSTLKITYPNKFSEADTRPMADWQNWKQTNSRSNANWHHSAYPWVYWCDLSLVSALQCDWTIQVWYEGREDLWKEYVPVHLRIFINIQRARSYMFSVHDPGKMFSEQVLGTRAFRLRALWNVLSTPSFRFKIGTHLGLRSMTYCVYTAQRVRSF